MLDKFRRLFTTTSDNPTPPPPQNPVPPQPAAASTPSTSAPPQPALTEDQKNTKLAMFVTDEGAEVLKKRLNGSQRDQLQRSMSDKDSYLRQRGFNLEALSQLPPREMEEVIQKDECLTQIKGLKNSYFNLGGFRYSDIENAENLSGLFSAERALARAGHTLLTDENKPTPELARQIYDKYFGDPVTLATLGGPNLSHDSPRRAVAAQKEHIIQAIAAGFPIKATAQGEGQKEEFDPFTSPLRQLVNVATAYGTHGNNVGTSTSIDQESITSKLTNRGM